ncbi:sugar ABC transporter permease [Paenibacillus phoenicis]|uniref:Multiple sugar transport system permease n=3 Tax=Paenibacillus TaxID=44249 RepID=R9LG27_9BACL|nr:MULTISPECIES: sugar ABC transporter permease [Paenibacillus]EOS54702.1 multiple sugar transport system permease [Paenibacillus barengoltzii G22]MDU0331854.1 sugar ABC transporter permease [Paenibacillus sp. 3LSP]MEA3572460.1 sugar ABC transporter permease [Paenibacillus phoenicis]SMF12454.1 multiple sugar transport system permease protein [Paenibacillus barengoltzii J12]
MGEPVISPGNMQQNTVKASTSASQKPRRGSNWKQYMWGYLFLVPAIAIFIVFLWVPIIKGMVYSFYNIDFVKGNTFVGFDNYVKVFHNPDVLLSVRNTLYYMLLCLVIGFWVPIAASIAISELRWFQGFARIAAYLPFVVPGVVLYGMWRWMYDPVGPINALLGWFGADPVSFISDGRWSMVSIVFMETWQQFGSAMLIYLAGVLSIPRDWYEAAEIDGAGVWARIKYITLPSMRNLIVLMLILQLIGTSQAYQSQLALLDGGPNKATLTYALLTVKYAFTQLDYGAGTALGVLMFIVLSVLGVLQYKLNKEEY